MSSKFDAIMKAVNDVDAFRNGRGADTLAQVPGGLPRRPQGPQLS